MYAHQICRNHYRSLGFDNLSSQQADIGNGPNKWSEPHSDRTDEHHVEERLLIGVGRFTLSFALRPGRLTWWNGVSVRHFKLITLEVAYKRDAWNFRRQFIFSLCAGYDREGRCGMRMLEVFLDLAEDIHLTWIFLFPKFVTKSDSSTESDLLWKMISSLDSIYPFYLNVLPLFYSVNANLVYVKQYIWLEPLVAREVNFFRSFFQFQWYFLSSPEL